MVLKTHVDNRGMFQELFKKSHGFEDFDIKQISFCTINPGETRGGHYHKVMNEVFIVVSGSMELRRKQVEKNKNLSIQTMNVYENQIALNKPYEWHEVYSKDGCEFIILLNCEFNSNDLDTYR